MKLIYTKSKWESPELSLEDFFKKTNGSGFDGVELGLFDYSREQIKVLTRKHQMDLVAWIFTDGNNLEAHLNSLKSRFEHAASFSPSLINSHIGKDYFSFEDNLTLFTKTIELSEEHNIDLVIETHRGRPTYSLPETVRYLKALPAMRLNADISHWMVVHESDLRDQEENLTFAINRADHIHARVGYEEGPQITDPTSTEWAAHVDRSIEIWQRIVSSRIENKSEILRITPEFGPIPYVHTLPSNGQPVIDVWKNNVDMKNILKEKLQI